MIDNDALASPRAENVRLTELLDAHGIAWRSPPQAQTPTVAELSRLTTDEQVTLSERCFAAARMCIRSAVSDPLGRQAESRWVTCGRGLCLPPRAPAAAPAATGACGSTTG